MENEKVGKLLNKFKNVIPREYLLTVKGKLENATEEVLERLEIINLKSPKLALVFSIFLGWIGIDRCYIGDVGLGICKFLFNACTLGIWGFVDIFLVYNKAKKRNFESIMLAL